MPLSRAAPGFLSALVMALLACVALGGCRTTVRDLAVAGVSVTDSAEWFPPAPALTSRERSNRLLLRVDLTTEENLTRALGRWGMLIHARAVLCADPGDYALLGSSLYTTLPRADELPRPLNSSRSVELPDGTRGTYYLPLNISQPPDATMKGAGVKFDLLEDPEDICISLRSAPPAFTTKWHSLRSNTVRLSRDAIREALSDAQSQSLLPDREPRK
jgi:hypothetical protein